MILAGAAALAATTLAPARAGAPSFTKSTYQVAVTQPDNEGIEARLWTARGQGRGRSQDRARQRGRMQKVTHADHAEAT